MKGIKMKILILDNKPHDELKNALKQYNIILDRVEVWSDKFKELEYSLIILCPSSKKQLTELFKTCNFCNINTVIFFKEIDSKFIISCSKQGCKDVIRIPYIPEAAAKRLNCLIESLSGDETGIVVPPKENQLSFDIDKYIQMEIQRSNRGKTPLSFLAVQTSKNKNNVGNVTDILKDNLRNTDFLSIYKNNILVMLPYCNKNGVHALKNKLTKYLSSYKTDIFCITKDYYYEKSLLNEREVLLGMLFKKDN